MDLVGPVAGAAQVVSTAPGVNVTGYGNTGATKYTVTLNGINQSWGFGGFTTGGALGVTFDAFPESQSARPHLLQSASRKDLCAHLPDEDQTGAGGKIEDGDRFRRPHLDKKELPTLEPGAMCYMMSKQQYLSDRDMSWHPHLMFFVAGNAAQIWGANLPGSPVIAADDPEERATIFLVWVGKWSDGTPAPQAKH